jgi:hypothetical protein
LSSRVEGIRILAVNHDVGVNGAMLLFQSAPEGLTKNYWRCRFQTFPREGPLVTRAKELGPGYVGELFREKRRCGFFDWITRGRDGARSGRAAYDLIFANTVASLSIVERMIGQEAKLAAVPLVVYVHESRFLLHTYDF